MPPPCSRARSCRPRSAPRSAASSPASPASPKPISSAPTCASATGASTRSCCATAASPSAGSTPATPAATMTMPARRPTTIPASTASTPATPPRSTAWARGGLGFRTDREYSTIGGVGATGTGGSAAARRQRLSQRRALSRPGAARECGPADLRRPGLLRFRHALLRRRICAVAHRHPAGPDRVSLLRLRPHDVRPRRGPGEAVARHPRVHPLALERRSRPRRRVAGAPIYDRR